MCFLEVMLAGSTLVAVGRYWNVSGVSLHFTELFGSQGCAFTTAYK